MPVSAQRELEIISVGRDDPDSLLFGVTRGVTSSF